MPEENGHAGNGSPGVDPLPTHRTLLEIWMNPQGQICLTGMIQDKVAALGLLELAKTIVLAPQPILDPNKIVSPGEVRLPPGIKLS